MDAIAEATEWLNNTSDYEKGLNILSAFGVDAFTFALLSSGADNFNRETLYSEISKKLDSGIKTNFEIESDNLIKDFNNFFDLYTKGDLPHYINPSETSELDRISSEQSALMDERSELKAKLRFLVQDNTKQPERKKIAFEILEISDELNRLEDDKSFFLQFGYLPSGPDPEDSEADLQKRQGNLRTYIVRYSKPGKNPDKLKEYQEELAIVDAKLKKYAVQG